MSAALQLRGPRLARSGPIISATLQSCGSLGDAAGAPPGGFGAQLIVLLAWLAVGFLSALKLFRWW